MRHGNARGLFAAVVTAALLLFVILGIAACGSEEEGTTTTTASATTTSAVDATTVAPTTTAEPTPLAVSAASSLRNAFTEIGAAFDKANNAKTTFNFDSSGTLQQQIEAGGPSDVFASAAMKQMDNLLKGKFVDESSVQVFASNEIVLAIPADSKLAIAGFADLAKPEVKQVAYGDPASVPHGTYAEEVLTTVGVLDQVKPKVIYAKNVAQTLEYVSSGSVDAGMMFSTDAMAGADNVKVVATSDPSQHSEIRYPIGVVSGSKNKTVAQAFVDFVMSSEGQAILLKYGFVAPSAG
jgi:molybdate transport system substrate-binding protein